MPTRAPIRKRLMMRRFHLLQRYQDEVARVDEELEQHEADTIDHASDQWDARVVGLLSENDLRALAEIVEAIRRLDAGRYGLCVACSCRIERLRLAALPATPLCIECARDEEADDRERRAGSSAPSANAAR